MRCVQSNATSLDLALVSIPPRHIKNGDDLGKVLLHWVCHVTSWSLQKVSSLRSYPQFCSWIPQEDPIPLVSNPPWSKVECTAKKKDYLKWLVGMYRLHRVCTCNYKNPMFVGQIPIWKYLDQPPVLWFREGIARIMDNLQRYLLYRWSWPEKMGYLPCMKIEKFWWDPLFRRTFIS